LLVNVGLGGVVERAELYVLRDVGLKVGWREKWGVGINPFNGRV
jgi:hypothetical protein